MVDLFLKHNENVSLHSADKWGLGRYFIKIDNLCSETTRTPKALIMLSSF